MAFLFRKLASNKKFAKFAFSCNYFQKMPKSRHFCALNTPLVQNQKCSGCGVSLQSKNKNDRGYVILEKAQIPTNYRPKWVIAKELEEKRLLINKKIDSDPALEKAETFLIKNNPPQKEQKNPADEDPADNNNNANTEKYKNRICVRCHQLKFQGKTRNSQNIDLENFWPKLKNVMNHHPQSAVLLLIDLFDFYGTILPELSGTISTDRPVIVAINKIDLLPTNCSKTRLNKWAAREIKDWGLSVEEILLISGKNNMNLGRLSESLQRLKGPTEIDIFVVGTTNVGKSTLINGLRQKRFLDGLQRTKATTSIFPGTTLDMLQYTLASGSHRKRVFDTPGLINSRQLAPKLEFEELKAITPTKRLKPRTYQLKLLQTLILGAGLGKITLVAGRPIYCTIFMPSTVSIHITLREKAEALVAKHAGNLVFPPFTAERVAELGAGEVQKFGMGGKGWDESVADIVFSGVGWVALTTCGTFEIEVSGVNGLEIAKRQPMLPFEARKSFRKFTGRAK